MRSSGITGISFFCSSLNLVVSQAIPQLCGKEDNTAQARMEQSFTHETTYFSEGLGLELSASAALSALPEGDTLH
jgi:hypothetical protein